VEYWEIACSGFCRRQRVFVLRYRRLPWAPSVPSGADCLRSAAKFNSIPVFSRKQGDFQEKQGGD
jgi:hypothetical protein